MNVEQLRAFVKVADSPTISAAASSLFVSQPSLSRSIARLERELGASLFERGRKGCELTEAGATFLPHARRALCELDRGLSSLLECPENALILGCTVEGLLAELLPGFIHAHPNVAIDQRTVNENCTVELVQSGSVDILISADIINAQDVMCISVDGMPYALYCNAASRWACCERLELSQLAEASFICDTSRMSRNELERCCGLVGFTPRITGLVEDFASICALLVSTDSVALMPLPQAQRIRASQFTSQIVCLPLAGPEATIPKAHLGFAYSTKHPLSNAASTFVEYARTALLQSDAEIADKIYNRSDMG